MGTVSRGGKGCAETLGSRCAQWGARGAEQGQRRVRVRPKGLEDMLESLDFICVRKPLEVQVTGVTWLSFALLFLSSPEDIVIDF